MPFLTFEGGEGAGKSTQVRLLAESLVGLGVCVLSTREPGGAPGAELLRGILLSGNISWSPQAEVLLHFAARAEHIAVSVRPVLAAGGWVICDRFTDSTMAYQGYGQGASQADIAALSGMLGLVPDLTVMLDISPELARDRLASRGGDPDRYERLGPAFFARVNAGFREIAAAEPERCVVLPADQAPDVIAASVLALVRARFGLPG